MIITMIIIIKMIIVTTFSIFSATYPNIYNKSIATTIVIVKTIVVAKIVIIKSTTAHTYPP